MSQTKAQLIQPIGIVTASTIQVSGVVTATTLIGDVTGTVTGLSTTTANLDVGIVTTSAMVGDVTGSASSVYSGNNIVAGVVTATKFTGNTSGRSSGLADGTNANIGIITATSFIGNLTGNAASLSTTDAQLNLGIVTATNFAGNFTGIGSGLTGTPNVVAGVVTSTFVGNFTGIGSGLSGTPNVRAGVVTASSFVGDFTGIGSGLTGTPNVTAGVVTASSFLGNFTGHASGLTGTPNVTAGLVTATSLLGNFTGFASGITGTPNITAGVITATSFAGNFTGIGSGLTGTPNYTAGIVTASSFIGNFTGIGSGLTGTPSFTAGIVTASSFLGNFTGVASGISGTPNITVAIMTATSYNGDGSSLTGIAATNWIANNVTANSSTTTVNLSLGNVVKFSQSADTTVSFANTGTSNIVTFIRTQTEDFSSAGVTFDGSGDSLSIPDNADYNFGSGDFTIECWAKVNSINNYNDAFAAQWVSGQYCFYFGTFQADFRLFWSTNGSAESNLSSGYTVTTGGWHHYAASRSGDSLRLFVDGEQKGSTQDMSGVTLHNSTTTVVLGNNADVGDGSRHLDGILSNVRIIKGTGLYTSDFSPLMSDLTNVTNTKLLCCQSNSSTTAATVIPSGDSITANGDPTAGSQTISLAGERTLTWPSAIKWNGGSAPTLDQKNPTGNDVNVITLLTRDEGVTWYGWETMSNSTATYQWWTWGNNETGMLGQNNLTDYSSPVQIPGSWTGFNKGNIGSNAAYGEVNIGAKADGTLWAWGDNEHGRLGVNSEIDYSSPVQIPGTDWGGSFIHASSNSFVIKSNGEMWAIGGGNYQGALGINVSGPSVSQARSSPTQIPGTTWKTVTTANFASAATKTDGTLWSWGYNVYGQLGQNNRTNCSSPTQIPGTTWDSVSGGSYNAGAIKTDGTLWMWGNNTSGVLGLNDRNKRSSPTQVPGSTWKSVVTTERSTVATKTDGTLWSWGMNNYGVFGTNDLTHRSSPVQVPGTTWNEIASNSYNVYATKTNGTLWAWGLRDKGQTGQNNTAPDNNGLSSPIQIPGKNVSFVSAGTKFGKAFVEE